MPEATQEVAEVRFEPRAYVKEEKNRAIGMNVDLLLSSELPIARGM